MKFSFDMSPADTITKRHGLGKKGAIQSFIDSQVMLKSAKYTPKDSGALLKSARSNAGEIVYTSPYAKFLYYGKVMVDSRGSTWAKKGQRKHVTNRNLQFGGAPFRGAFWFEKVKQNHLREIIEGVESNGR